MPLATLLVIILLSTDVDHNSPTPVLSTLPVPTSSQTFTSIPPIQITNPSNNPFYTLYFSSSFSHTGPIVFPGGPPEFPYFGLPLPESSSTFLKTVSLPSYAIHSMVTPTAKPIPFFSFDPSLCPVLDPTEGMVEVPEVPTLGGGGLPWAEPPPLPVARRLPFPAIFGLTISHLWSPLGVHLLAKP